MRYALFLIALMASPAVAETHGTVTLGGSTVEHGATSEASGAEVITTNGHWEGIYTFNNTYQRSKGATTVNLIAGEIKENYNLSKHLYAISDVRYDYDGFRAWRDTGVIATGLGYRIVHNAHLKISNEVTGGIRITDFGQYGVVRDSLWIRYNTGRVELFSKVLYEKSNLSYYREQSGVNLRVTKMLTFGLQNLYSKDVKENNVTTFNLGVKF